MPLDPNYWLTQKIAAIERQLRDLSMIGVLNNASSDGTNGWLKISAKAVSGQPALEFHYTGGGGDLLAQIYQTTAGAVQITGGLQVSGTKNFVMSHPSKPGWLLRHASTESPVNGVEYWGEAVLDANGVATVKLPAYFEDLTKTENRIVMLTAIGTPNQLAYEPIVAGAFTVRGASDARFSWLVKAERASQPGDWPIDFAAEEQGDILPPPEDPAPRTVTPSSPMVDTPPATEPPPAEAPPADSPTDPPSDLAPVETTP